MGVGPIVTPSVDNEAENIAKQPQNLTSQNSIKCQEKDNAPIIDVSDSEPLAVKHLPTCNKVAEQSIFQGSRSSCSANSGTYSIGGSERSEANASSLKIPMHNVPLDNLSSKTS